MVFLIKMLKQLLMYTIFFCGVLDQIHFSLTLEGNKNYLMTFFISKEFAYFYKTFNAIFL